MSYNTTSSVMPWRDTPKNRERWKRLQSSDAFLYEQQRLTGGQLACHYCGLGPLTIVNWDDQGNQGNPHKATVDHVIPMSRGGVDVPANMVVCCMPCNLRKGSKMPTELY